MCFLPYTRRSCGSKGLRQSCHVPCTKEVLPQKPWLSQVRACNEHVSEANCRGVICSPRSRAQMNLESSRGGALHKDTHPMMFLGSMFCLLTLEPNVEIVVLVFHGGLSNTSKVHDHCPNSLRTSADEVCYSVTSAASTGPLGCGGGN